MKSIRISAMTGLLCAVLLLSGPWPAAAQDGGQSDPTLAAPSGGQDFQDVPVGSTFYTFIHNLKLDGVTSGYPCQPGGLVDPCVPPGNLPYYHPGSNVTRGQNAKFTDNGRRVLTGPHIATGSDYGLFSAINTAQGNSFNAGVYAQGAIGVMGESFTNGTAGGTGGYFYNRGGGMGEQVGVLGHTAAGWGLVGASNGDTGVQASAGVLGLTTVDGGAGGVFTSTAGFGSVGVVAWGHSGGVLVGAGSSVVPSGDGLDVGATGGTYDAIYTAQPSGDTNYSFYGAAHIHGSNVSADDYESEVVYRGAKPLALGSVVALDPANVRGGPLGVVPVTADKPDAAIGVLSYRLSTAMVNGVAKTVIDAQATAVQPSDRAYITILGRVAMPLPAGTKVGIRLALSADGAAVVAAPGADSFGRVASLPDAAGWGDVLVNFK